MPTPGRLALLALAVLFTGLVGCHKPIHEPREYDITAQYRGLDGKRVAVIVAVSDQTNYQFPDARARLTRDISRRIQLNVPEVQVTNPDEVLLWQNANEYWTARPPSMLIASLGVERLVIVEVGEYRVTDSGDTNIKRGVISANVNVVEDDAPDPDNYAFSDSLRVAFPDEFRTKIGLVQADVQDIYTITVSYFTEEAAGYFYDHTITR
jgi:hypothetical protein